MRKILCIPLIVLILFTGITVNIAAHYCTGMFIASEISLSGKLATCGMEHAEHGNPGFNEADHTCQDFTYSYTFSSNYVPAPLNLNSQQDMAIAATLPLNILLSTGPHSAPCTVIRPPGVYYPARVELEEICIYRI